jgi:NAD(P)-dependent dehydrogenase (short-subunit alcohol dehydrogenase family)
MDPTNASAIVTGGAGGFGSATVRRLEFLKPLAGA